MQITENPSRSAGSLAIGFASALGASAAIVALPSIGAQLAGIGLAGVALATILSAVSRRLPNAAWVIVLGVYLVDALGSWATSLSIGVSVVYIIALIPIPFVLVGLWQDPSARSRMVHVAPLAGLVAAAGLSLAWSEAPAYGLRKAGLFLLNGVLPAASILVLASAVRPPAWRPLLVVAVAYAVALLAIGTADPAYPGRLTFFDGNPIWIARAAYIGAIIAIFGPFPRALRAIVIVPLLLAGYLTDSLGPTVGLVLGVGAGIAETIRIAPGGRRRARTRLAILGTLVAIALAVTGSVLADDLNLLAPVVTDPNVTSRAAFLQAAAEMFLTSPLVGAGFGSFAALGLPTLYPHSLLPEVGAELGIVGLALVLAWLAVSLRAAARSPLLLALIVAAIAFSSFSGDISGNTELWTLTALAVAMRSRGMVVTTAASPIMDQAWRRARRRAS